MSCMFISCCVAFGSVVVVSFRVLLKRKLIRFIQLSRSSTKNINKELEELIEMGKEGETNLHKILVMLHVNA